MQSRVDRELSVARHAQAVLRELMEAAQAERMLELSHFIGMAYMQASDIVRMAAEPPANDRKAASG